MYIKYQYKSSITKNHKIIFFNCVPLKGCVASLAIFRFCARNQTKHSGKIK